jgi:hypothetical protein
VLASRRRNPARERCSTSGHEGISAIAVFFGEKLPEISPLVTEAENIPDPLLNGDREELSTHPKDPLQATYERPADALRPQ